MHQITVYGSLKAGRYNHRIIEDSYYIGKTTVKGTLYAVSSYPALIEEGDNEYEAEIYEVSDDVFNRVNRMELGAGYKLVDGVYYADNELSQYCKDNCKQIDSY